MTQLLNREALLVKEALEIKKVEFADGNYVYVRQMTGRERDTFEQSLLKKVRDKKGTVVSYEQSTEDFRAKLAVSTVCDEEGNLLLAFGDYALLSVNMSARKLETIVNVAQALNNISEEDKEALVKKLSADQDGNSNSDSAEN